MVGLRMCWVSLRKEAAVSALDAVREWEENQDPDEDDSKAAAAIAALEKELEERDELLAMLERGGVRIVSEGGAFTLAEFRQALADLAARYKEREK